MRALTKDRDIEKKDKELVASLLGIGLRTVERIWREANDQIAAGLPLDVSNKKKGRSGRKRKDIDLARIPTIPLNRRKTLRALSRSLGVSCTTLHRRFKWGEVKRHTSSLKPLLKPENKISRLKFCISMLDETTLENDRPSFNDMSRIVHIDEKWFDMTKRKSTYYLLPQEEAPLRTVPNKNSIGKVMFLTAVAKPRYDENGVVTFDGKIGVWAFVKETPAARRSEYRPRGTLEIKSVIVTRDVMREYICEKVVPAIQDLWPDEDVGKTFFIQQDNARTHVKPTDPVFLQVVSETYLCIQLLQQPANSPDLNGLDLCFFRALQSLTDCRGPKTIRELIQHVEEEYLNYDVDKLARVFVTLQSCMLEVMKQEGGINYKIPHMNKEGL